MENFDQNKYEAQSPGLREQIQQYIKYWPWFVICVVIALILAQVFLRYTAPIYQTVATILIKDDRNSNLSEMAIFKDLGMTTNISSGFENEIEILKSRNLTRRVVKSLNLNISYFSEGSIRSEELFESVPFQVIHLNTPDSLRFSSFSFYVTPLSEKEFNLKNDEKEEGTVYEFGKVIPMPVGEAVIIPDSEQLAKNNFYPVKVRIQNIPSAVSAYRGRIQAEPQSKSTNIIQLSLNIHNPEKARAVLNELIKQYNLDAISDRNMVARNTAEFINGRLEIITEELDSVETGKVIFQRENKLTDLSSEGQMFLQSESEYGRRQIELETQLELIQTMISYVEDNQEMNLLPANLGIERSDVSTAINNYNQLVLEKERLLTSSTEKNPVIVSLNEQIEAVRTTILSGLANAKTAVEIAKKDLKVQEDIFGSKILSIPSKEKIFRSISRQQEIKEALYLYLLQKREENAISLAVTAPKAKVVDFAYSTGRIVYPNAQNIRLAAFLIGLLLPFSVIYLRDLLDNKIRDRAFIESRTQKIPLLGEIPKLDKKTPKLIGKNDHSIMAESFRILRTNLQYMFLDDINSGSEGKVIFSSSAVKGEGKTMVSANLAITLANSGAKVILVGGDFRNPQLQNYIPEFRNKDGVVDYLVHQNTSIHDYIQPSTQISNLSLLSSGTIPPNPAELWMRPRVKTLFDELRKKFDYVIVDTAPLILVADTLLISKYSDVVLFILRAGYTEKKLLDFPIESVENEKLKNLAFVLNNVSKANFGYGNKYGYTYHRQKQTMFEKLWNR